MISQKSSQSIYTNTHSIFFLFTDFVVPQRVILAIMGFLAILNAYTMRISLSVAITELVVKKNYTGDDENAVCEADNLDDGTNVRNFP